MNIVIHINQHPGLTARDVVHLAVCHQYQVKKLKTFDRNLSAAFYKH